MPRQFPVDPRSGAAEIRCIWCDRVAQDWTQPMFEGHVVVCACGAMALFAPPHDFDEAGDELLRHLRIDATVAEPAQPVGRTGLLSVQAYDAVAARRRLAEILATAGHETRSEDAESVFSSSGRPRRAPSWGLWWRPSDPG